jgi:hypothetical protein
MHRSNGFQPEWDFRWSSKASVATAQRARWLLREHGVVLLRAEPSCAFAGACGIVVSVGAPAWPDPASS